MTSETRGRLGIKQGLDLLATVAMLAAAGVVIWSNLGRTSSPPRPPAPTVDLPAEPISLDGAATLGAFSAKAALIVFSDFQCPYCARFSRDVLPQLRTDYVDTGKILVAFRHNPIEKIHAQARAAAEAAECARRQGRFWEFHDRLFADISRLAPADLDAHATALGLDRVAFAACAADQARPHVDRDRDMAQTYRFSGTPAFFIGVLQANRTVQAKEVITGAKPLAAFVEVIAKILK